MAIGDVVLVQIAVFAVLSVFLVASALEVVLVASIGVKELVARVELVIMVWWWCCSCLSQR